MGTERPIPKSEAVRAQMVAQKRRDTLPEVALRRALHAMGMRFRVGLPVPGTPRRTMDVAFTRAKVAIFVDGCFWHGCPTHGVDPKNNAAWWSHKLAENRRRDEETTRHLEALGWTVMRIWEHEDATAAAATIRERVLARTGNDPARRG